MNIFTSRNITVFLNKLTIHNKNRFSTENKLNNQKPFISKLTNRSLLIIHGYDAFKLLQGLTTNDINLLKSNPNIKNANIDKKLLRERISIYTLFLNPKGKLITDAFIYRPKVFENGTNSFRQNQLWVDVDTSMKKQLYYHLQKYTWKKQVEILDVDKQKDQNKPSVYVGYNHISTISNYLDQGCEIELTNNIYRQDEYSNMMFFDPRGGNYGRRILCMQEEFGIPIKEFNLVQNQQYDDYQRTLGFTPSILSTKKLPFQFNFDLLNAVSFKKGCYLGQQIVSRSYFTGIVRRRVFPFFIQNQIQIPTEQLKKLVQGTKLINNQGQQIGKVIYYEKNKNGLALVNYLQFLNEDLQKSQQVTQIKIKLPFQGYVYCPFQQQLNNYVSQTKKKQKNLEQLDI